MQTSFVIGIGSAVFLALAGAASAKPADLICEVGGNAAGAVHLIVDTDAKTVVWYGQQFQSQVTDTQVHWSGNLNVRPGVSLYTEGTLDRYTGALSYYSAGGYDSKTGQNFTKARTAYSCAKAGARITDPG